ncbi:MAG: FtsX-like permease family protein [Acaryochloris sp. RU_4_1]|nr:FtsX-like permease family protein [Acaryochloris sp. SU_5_25]NJM67676.1 FtsX-like permease family protein [Acaryochloris sp. RU_4_1]NJR56407.1 FtsX-like permease family protein [Acaryochloris sp. CRU_2_0]
MIPIPQPLARRTPLGWLQLSHEKGRLLVALAGIAFADVLMFMQMGFQNSLFVSNTQLHRSLNADIVLLSPQARNLQALSTFTRRRLYQAEDIPGVQSAEPVYVSTLNWKNPQTKRETVVQVLGFNPDRPALNLPGLKQLLPQVKQPNTFLFDRGARGDYAQTFAQIDRGQAVQTEAQRRTITISGLFQMGASFGADGTLITSDQNFLLQFPRWQAGSINLGLIQLDPGADPAQVVAALNDHLPADVRALTLEQFIAFETAYWQVRSPVGFIFGLGTAMAFVVGVVIVYQVLSTDVNAHIREYATFKAMGYQNRYLLGVVFEEAIILALFGFIPGAILPVGLYALTRSATALPVFMTTSRAITVFLLTVVMCTLSGAIATRKLQSADPADMF